MHSTTEHLTNDRVRSAWLRFLGLIFLAGFLPGVCLGATASYRLTDPSNPDLTYNDGESIVMLSSGGGAVSVKGVGYSDYALGTDRWGILDGSKPWNGGKKGVIIRNGFAPSAVGSTTSLQGGLLVSASYISVKVNRPANTLFTNVTLELTGKGLIYPNVWAGTAGSAVAGVRDKGKESGTTKISFNFASINDPGVGSMELRVYGFVGADSGELKSVNIQYGFVAVPEPEVCTTLMLAGLALLGRRRRSAAR